MPSQEDIECTDSPLPDEDAQQHFADTHAKRPADVTDQVRGRERKEAPSDHDWQLLSAQEPAYAGDMIRMPGLEVFGELQALREIVEASGRHEDPADREQEVSGRGQEQQAERNQVGHRNQLFERPLTERRASFRLYYPTMAGRYFPTGRK